jgi:hypothetical protein
LSVDGGQNFIKPNGPTHIFDNLGEGDYDIIAKNLNSNCEIYWSENTLELRAPEGDETELCLNGGFESGDFSEWEGRIGTTNDNVHSLPNIGFGNNFNFSILSNYTDPFAPIVLPFSGTYTLRMGSQLAGGGVESIEKCFIVTEDLVDFNFNYALVLQDPNHSPMSDNPSFAYYFYKIESNGNKSLLNELSFEVIADINDDYFKYFTSGGNDYVYKGWTCVNTNFSNYLNQELCIKFVNSDCKPGAHWGYSYIDGVCGDGIQNSPVLLIGDHNPTVCCNQPIIIDIQEAKGFNKYSILVEKYSSSNQLVDILYFEEIDYVLLDKLNIMALFHNSIAFFECNFEYHVIITLFNDCSDPAEQSLVVNYVSEEYDISYKDIIVCGQPNVNVVMQGINTCFGCPIQWEPSYLLSDNTLHFPVVLGAYFSNAFSTNYTYQVITSEGCSYSGGVNTFFLPKPKVLVFSDNSHCHYKIMIRINYDFLNNNFINNEYLDVKVLRNGVEIIVQYFGIDQLTKEHIYISEEMYSNLFNSNIITSVSWDFDHLSDDYIVVSESQLDNLEHTDPP